ncbi:hypothetical protein FF1_010479 [Malus domestica]
MERDQDRDRIRARDRDRGRDSDRERDREEAERDRNRDRSRRSKDRAKDSGGIQTNRGITHHAIVTITVPRILPGIRIAIDIIRMLELIVKTPLLFPYK